MRVRRSKKGLVSTYSDHFSVEIVFSDLPRAGKLGEEETEKGSVWNLRKEGGWEKYKNETEKVAQKVVDIVEKSELSIEECMKEIETVNNKVKFVSFGKN